MKPIEVQGLLHPAFFATKDIDIGQEILYDYGTNKHEWRQKVSVSEKPVYVFYYNLLY